MIQEVSLANNLPLPEKGRPCLYQDVDEQQLQKDAEACLANYGTKFESQIMTGSNGLYVYTASGTRVLDWTVSAYATAGSTDSDVANPALVVGADVLLNWTRPPRNRKDNRGPCSES